MADGREDTVQMRTLRNDDTEIGKSATKQSSKEDPSNSNDLNVLADRERQTSAAEEIKEYPTGVEFWLIILTLGALLILGGLDTNIVATVVPRYAERI